MSPGDRDQASADPTTRARADAPSPADVGIVAAMSMEVGYLVDRLRGVRKYHAANMPVIEGMLDNKVVVIAIGGMGRDRARRATSLLLDGHRPTWMISAGFAGALDPTLRRNDLALPVEVTDTEGRRFPIDQPEGMGAGVAHVNGRLLTVDRVILSAAEKQTMREATGASLVDMETSAIAEECQRRLIRFLSIRIVSDDASADLPPEVASLMTKSGTYRIGAAFRAVWNRPSSLKDFWTLHEHAIEAADRLAAFVTRCINELPA